VRHALERRADLHAAKLSIDQNDINIRYYKNQILPDVNFQAQYSAAGLGGVQLLPVSTLTGDVTATGREVVSQRSFSSALGDIFNNAYPAWTVGFQINYPLGVSTAKASLEKAKLQYQVSQTQLRNTEMQIVAQVRSAARSVEANQKRVESARASRELAEEKLAAEEKKFAAGIEQAFFVFQAQRDLSSARTVEVQAIADYNKSLVDFEAVQEVSIGGTTGGITPIPSAGG
jgi:outer membrane protein TolC